MKKDLKARKSGNFDGISNKFDANIYGTSKGRLRHILLCHYLRAKLYSVSEASPVLKVLDLGAGTGFMSAEFVALGHSVTLVDASSEALDIAKQRVASLPKCMGQSIKFVHADLNDAQTFEKLGKFDLVLCHALLEWLEKPDELLRRIAGLLLPKGVFSLSFFNQNAKLFNNLLYGNFDYVNKGLPSRNTVRLNPHNAQDPKHVIDLLSESSEMELKVCAGIRCIHDYMNDKSKIEQHFDELIEAEKKYGQLEPYKWLGKYFYLQLEQC